MRFCSTCRRVYQEDHHEFCSADGGPLAAVESDHDPLVGVELDGRYRLVRQLGAGGNGVVYLAEQIGLGRPVALKMLWAERIRDERAIRRFDREARVLASLDHPGCVRVLDYTTTGGVPYLVMELVEGVPLNRLLRHGGLEPRHAVHVIAQIADAIDAAHRGGIVHRDLKPENAILDARDGQLRVRLIDFGLAIVTEAEGRGDTRLTRDGLIIGTPEYMAPEQILGKETDGRTDLYALGVMLYELLTGEAPFSGEDGSATVLMHLEQPPPPLVLAADVSEEAAAALGAHIAALLEKRPEDRPRDAEEVARTLRRIELQLPDAGPVSSLVSLPPPRDDGAPTEALRDTADEEAASLLPAARRGGAFAGVGRDGAEDDELARALDARRRGQRVRMAVGVAAVLLALAATVPFALAWIDAPEEEATSTVADGQPLAPPGPAVQRVALEATDPTSGTEEPPSEALPTAGFVDLPGGEAQQGYEVALRALHSELSHQGLRPRDVSSHPRARGAWTQQARAAREQRYAEATSQLATVSEVAASMSAREWMVYRLRHVEQGLGAQPAPDAAARARALWRTLDQSSSRPADVRRFMQRVDEIETSR